MRMRGGCGNIQHSTANIQRMEDAGWRVRWVRVRAHTAFVRMKAFASALTLRACESGGGPHAVQDASRNLADNRPVSPVRGEIIVEPSPKTIFKLRQERHTRAASFRCRLPRRCTEPPRTVNVCSIKTGAEGGGDYAAPDGAGISLFIRFLHRYRAYGVGMGTVRAGGGACAHTFVCFVYFVVKMFRA